MNAIVANHERQADFYRAERPSVIQREVRAGQVEVMEVAQSRGDYSDPATQDLQIIRGLSRAHCHVDFGAGRISTWASAGDYVVSPPHLANSVVIDQSHRIDFAVIRWADVRACDISGLLPSDGDFGPLHRRVTRDPWMDRMFDQLWTTDEQTDALQSQSLALAIVLRLAEWAKRPAAAPRTPIEQLSSRALALCKERLGAAVNPPPTLTELAALCDLSPFHFCRAFRAATGLPPHQYQMALRMERARALLADTRLSIAEVGTAVGYDDPAYFSRLFRRQTGVTPSEWRNAKR